MNKFWEKLNKKYFIPYKILFIILIVLIIFSSWLIYAITIGNKIHTPDLTKYINTTEKN